MVFSSNIFLFFFLPAVLLLYFLLPRKLRNAVLLIGSLIFYAWGEPAYVFLMIVTILLNYVGGLALERQMRAGRSAKGVLVCTVVLNLGLLAFFKYAGFFMRSLLMIPGLPAFPIPEIVLPIGISFYIFQSMSYVIDVRRGEVRAQHSLLSFATYVSMFPQLIAGPIVRYRDVAGQLDHRKENLTQFAAGVELFVLGLSKKLLLANPMGAFWESIRTEPGMAGAWIGMFAYTLQIYFDFSGYSDMAIGLGRMFGFEFRKNFDYPYLSQSVTEFWRRWHISLSSWFREYVYIPLGGNRLGLRRQMLNILIVWALTGLWHGANWNFVFWGLYYAVFLMAEKLGLSALLARVPGAVRHMLTILIVSFGWMLFYFENSAALSAFLAKLVSFSGSGAVVWSRFFANLPLMLFAALAATPLPKRVYEKLPDPGKLLILAALFALCAAALATQSYNPFIYFRF